MAYGFLDIASTPSVKAAQEANDSLEYWSNFAGNREFDRFTEVEEAFIASRDSFYIATTSESGWPYVQHRGGPPGFLRVLDEKTLAFAEFRGNRQYITLGNVAVDDRAALFLMDYPGRRRLKVFARIEVKTLADQPELASNLAVPGYTGKVERTMIFHLETFDWNCPQHITPRFTEAEVERAIMPIRDRIRELEDENAELRERLSVQTGG